MPPGVPYRILAVDDVRSNLLTIRAILPPTEFSLQGAGGAEEAFSLLAAESFDLILLDVLLPGLNGYDIARRLKAQPETAPIPILFLTSLKDEEEIVRAFEAGGVDFITKPFFQAELLLRVRTHLALRDKTDALERAAQQLREAKETRDRFFSILAHDLKNPFAGFLSLLEEIQGHHTTMDVEDVTESLQTMTATAQNVYRLLETLLDWGRSQMGGLTLDPQVFPLRDLLDEALEPLAAAFERKAIQLVVEPRSWTVRVDRSTVVTILRNLLSNAYKFTHRGGRVVCRAVLEGELVALAISDTGVGMPESRRSQLFLLDQKSSTVGTAREPGTGLGLILCSEFAQRNGGSLSVESQINEGSTFLLRLPAALVDCPNEDQAVSSQP